jgi:hypothetical protein
MRRSVAVGLGLVVAVSLTVALGARYSVRDPLIVTGAFALTVLVVAVYRRSRGLGTDVVRVTVAGIAAIATFLSTFSGGCDDGGDLSYWERCQSLLGTPILEWPGHPWWPILIPVLLSTGVGMLAWWLVGAPDDRRGDGPLGEDSTAPSSSATQQTPGRSGDTPARWPGRWGDPREHPMRDLSAFAWELLASMTNATGRLHDDLDLAHERLVNWLSESPANVATGNGWLHLVRTRSGGFSEGSTEDSAMTEFSLREPIERAIRGRAEGGELIGLVRDRRWSIQRWWRDRRLPRS